MLKKILASLFLVVALACPAVAEEKEPTTGQLVVAGGIASIAQYFIHIGVHEAGHAAAVKYYGAHLSSIDIFPTKDDNGDWHLGMTRYWYWEGDLNNKELANIALTPHYINLGMMGLFVGLYETGLMPKNKFGRLGLAIIAAGAALDTGVEALIFRKGSDLRDGSRLLDMSKQEKALFRLGVGAVSLVTLIEVCRVLYEVFFTDCSVKTTNRTGLSAKITLDGSMFVSYSFSF